MICIYIYIYIYIHTCIYGLGRTPAARAGVQEAVVAEGVRRHGGTLYVYIYIYIYMYIYVYYM